MNCRRIYGILIVRKGPDIVSNEFHVVELSVREENKLIANKESACLTYGLDTEWGNSG